MNALKTVLFVCYGSGHVRMVLPVAKALHDTGEARVKVLALTTAAPLVREAGLPLVQFKDFVRAGVDDEALAHGRRLAAAMGEVADREETEAYLGLSYADLLAEVGPEEAEARFARDGRQAFLPRRTLQRMLEALAPDLVVATNSPRAERAAIEAAGALGIPSLCIVDLFAIDEVRWIGRPGYADRVCVLNESVREFLVAAGRGRDEIVITGNPAFDSLQDAPLREQGAAWRSTVFRGKRVVLWAAQVEPAVHPFDGRPGDVTLPDRAVNVLVDWVNAQDDAVLCVRARAGQALDVPGAVAASLQDGPGAFSAAKVLLTGQDWPLAPLLHAVDCVATLTSTVGLEGHLAGARLVQVTGSVFDEAMPLARFGMADAAVPVEELAAAIDRVSRLGRQPLAQFEASATSRVLSVLRAFL